MAYQAAKISRPAVRVYQTTGNKAFLVDARKIDSYSRTVFHLHHGTFFATQDADLNAHEKDKPFVDGTPTTRSTTPAAANWVFRASTRTCTPRKRPRHRALSTLTNSHR